VLHTTLTVVSGGGPSRLRDQIAAAGDPAADFAVVPVQAGERSAAAAGERGSCGAARHDPAGPSSLQAAAPCAEPVSAAELAPFLPCTVPELLALYQASGTVGEVTDIPADLGSGLIRLIFLGTGDGSAAALRRAGATLGRRVASQRIAVAALPRDAAPEQVQAFAEGILLGSYRYALPSNETADQPDNRSGAVRLIAPEPASLAAVTAAVGRATAVAAAVSMARDLINTPAARKTPQWLAAQALSLAERCGLGARVRTAGELAAAGFGGITAVGAGSAAPPCLIELSYAPPGWRTHVVLVGKGITFDSGGLSLKPLDNMKLMKTDMAGGAVVMATLSVAAALGIRCKITGLVPAAENMPSGSAMRPGDVITQYGGRTVEIINTDAEGRLVIADALAYADLTMDPDVLVDVATLTGAARMALGTTIGALFTDHDDLAAALVTAGEAGGERLWRLPLATDYGDALESTVADLAHISARPQGRPTAIEAALFLREFSGGRPWAHLDIAGTARAAADDGEISKGATGFGTRLLLRWLATYP
jgi:leucyl aminopeptidase